MSALQPPAPEPDSLSEEFWACARDGRFVIQQCNHCGTLAHPPVGLCDHDQCSHLLEPSFSFQPVSGLGRLVSWTIIRRAFVGGFENRVPLVYALVELQEQAGLYFASELLCDSADDLSIGQPVKVEFSGDPERPGLPVFTRVNSPQA